MPTLDRPQYIQKIMDILGAPPKLILKLTTYRKKWVPLDIYDQPESLVDELAWVVCVAARKAKSAFVVEKFIPIREVKIVKAERSDGTLILWLEMHNYLKCSDYQKFRQELENTGKPLPAAENSYIMSDVSVSSVDVVSSQNEEMENNAWKTTVDSIGSMEAFRNSVFYRLLGISEEATYVDPKSSIEYEEPYSYYKLVVNKTYQLKIHYHLPEAQFEFCPQVVKTTSSNEWIKFYDESKINDRVGNSSVHLKPSQVADQHPYNHPIGIDIFIESSQLFAPRIRILTIFAKETVLAKVKRNVGAICCSAAFIVLFFVGQLLTGVYPEVNGVSPLWAGIPIPMIGAALSTFAITLVPIALAMWKKED
jgi:hypothetical protein